MRGGSRHYYYFYYYYVLLHAHSKQEYTLGYVQRCFTRVALLSVDCADDDFRLEIVEAPEIDSTSSLSPFTLRLSVFGSPPEDMTVLSHSEDNHEGPTVSTYRYVHISCMTSL